MANTSLPALTERTATANSDLIHVNSGGTDYKETKANFLSDVNSSISALNNSLANWNYYQVGSNSYGAVECRYNPSLKLCFMTWRGNRTAPGSTQYSFDLPSSPVLTPNDNAVVKLRNGDVMEVRTDNTVKVTLTGTSWSGGSLMYPTR